MLEKLWPFGKNRVRRALEEALEKAFKESGETLEPLSELQEHEDHYLLRVEVPGLGPENLEVRLEGEQLVVEGEKREEKRTKHLAEIVYGRIYRAYLLPKDAQKEGLEARLHKGVLEVRIPREKRPAEPPVKIPVREG
ncbi:MAG: Hsp20/alpha crystallin family protein [Thermus sp.]|uniref:Hsp20/alpha crystallin family protein n=1 Tax=Thermus sp. TaxID=275 RepID=UPI0025E85BC3|nr:Hsp20/alpha crystallin family protein [Thermus sp.]MCS6867157.1 Hsp20/alpha crystallin family protein [Thermus sp.]MCS7218223.1 Hsp20/alpha crystallin family protein [Thermus sp.]MCX7850078.1 Hsp20/alpha crystallin family protein [Thermus sp.]MDW8017064.1 Hsp20/alpha crystallin family protein [Thermus sp.]MDW8356334.1 Hsp20/alpha crystallin family protein [Thermus sp.]